MARTALPLTASLLAVFCGSSIAAQEVVERKKVDIELRTRMHETEHYSIEHEVTIRSASVERIAKELEDVLEHYVRVFRVTPNEKLRVMFLETRNTYGQMGGPPSSAGFYSPSNIDDDGSVTPDRRLYLVQLPFHELIPTVYHEAFHQYLDLYLGHDASIPVWFNEGMAEYYGSMQRGQGFQAKLDANRIDRRNLRVAKSKVAARTNIPLDELIDASREEFYDKSVPGRMALHYSQSFSVICFLMDSSNGKLPLAFAEALRNTKGDAGHLHGLAGGTTAMLDAEWSMFRIFAKEKPRVPTLVCIGEKDVWAQREDMQSVAKFLRAIPVRFGESGVLPFFSQPYEFTRAVELFFKKYPPPEVNGRKREGQ